MAVQVKIYRDANCFTVPTDESFNAHLARLSTSTMVKTTYGDVDSDEDL